MPPSFDSGNGKSGGGNGISPRLIGALILIAILVVFVFENRQKTDIRFLIPTIKRVPLWVALFVAMLLGVISGYLLGRRQRDREREGA
jgi:uncharacterized integral membrane protein